MNDQKKTKTKVVAGVFKLLCLIAFLNAGAITAQNATPEVLPFPATQYGQRLLISSENPMYAPMMQSAERTRSQAIRGILENPNGEPNSYTSCTPTVCCSTTLQSGVAGGNVFVTVCWGRSSGEILHTSLQMQ
jgi:hypothetical protein